MGKTQPEPYDPLFGLDTPEDIVEYIDVLLEDGDVPLFKAALTKEIVPAIKKYDIDMNEVEHILEHFASQRAYIREHVGHILAVCWKASRERDQSVSQPLSSSAVSKRESYSGVPA